MIRVAYLQLLNPALLACGVLLVFVLFAVEARAECGDYVVVSGGQKASAAHRLTQAGLPQKVAGTIRVLPSNDSRNDSSLPCYGPGCSKRAPAGPPIPLVQSMPDWALPTLSVLVRGSQQTLLDFHPGSTRSFHHFGRIMRPPRVL